MHDGIEARAAALAEMMEVRMGIRGRGLEAKLRRAGRLLPRRLRRAGREVVEAARMAGNPKLSRRLDPLAVARSAELMETHLAAIDPVRRRFYAVVDIMARQAFNLLAVGVLVLVVLRLRGFV